MYTFGNQKEMVIGGLDTTFVCHFNLMYAQNLVAEHVCQKYKHMHNFMQEVTFGGDHFLLWLSFSKVMHSLCYFFFLNQYFEPEKTNIAVFIEIVQVRQEVVVSHLEGESFEHMLFLFNPYVVEYCKSVNGFLILSYLLNV